MPLYDFKCDFCKRTFELHFDMNSLPVATACRLCGTLKIQAWPMISAPRAIKIDQGRHYSVAFGKEFKNEKDLRDYAKHNGFEPLENASPESLERSSRVQQEIEKEKLYESMSEDLTWSNYNG